MDRALASFTRMFAKANSLDIARWRLEPGMCHRDTHAWWGQMARRKQIHLGIDFARYETSDGTVRELEAGMLVPMPLEGAVVGIIKDFLGNTVVVNHGKKDGRLVIGLYGHVKPLEDMLGCTLDAGSIIADLAHPAGRSPVPPHLHLGLALVSENTDFRELSWDYLNSAADVEHIDPIKLLDEIS